MSDTIRVLVVDDSSVMRVGLSALVEVDPGLVEYNRYLSTLDSEPGVTARKEPS